MNSLVKHISPFVLITLVTQFVLADEAVKAKKSDIEQELRRILIQYSSLKDPFSVQFRGVETQLEDSLYCGELNSKNSYGAYSGWSKFAIKKEPNSSAPKILIDEREDDRTAADLCSYSGDSTAQVPVIKNDAMQICGARRGKPFQMKVATPIWPIKKDKHLFLPDCEVVELKRLYDECDQLKLEGLSYKPADVYTTMSFLEDPSTDYKGALAIIGLQGGNGDLIGYLISNESGSVKIPSVRNPYRERFSAPQKVLCMEK